MRRRSLLRCAPASLLAAAWPLRAARAADVPTRLVGLDVVGGWLTVSVGLQDLLGPEARKKLFSGFVTRVLLRVYLYRAGERDPLVGVFRRTELVYDIWSERFEARTVDGSQGAQLRQGLNEGEATFLATALWRFPLIERAQLEPDVTYRIGVRGDLNPLSQELLAEARRRLLRPGGRGRGGAGDTFFGSFVSIFVNPRIEESERQVLFLSQPFSGAGLPAAIGGPR